jgi:hypothetical protein
MAVTKEDADALFDALSAAVADDTLNANGLANLTQSGGAYSSNAVLVGNINGAGTGISLIRVGDPRGTRHYPRLECEIFLDAKDSPAYARSEGMFRLHLFCNRVTPSGFGQQTNVALRIRQVMHRKALTTNGGWYFSQIQRYAPIQLKGSDTEQHLVIPFAVVMSAGTGGGF